MEVHIISRELVKPSSHHQKPFKLSLLDQITPTTYSPVIFFYNKGDASSSVTQHVYHLKKSLSDALTLYYPLSGRIVDNLYVDHFHEGVPFVEARVSCRLSDFLKHLEVESLNRFLPCQPFTMELQDTPPMALQVNIFDCGGMVLGWCASHKLIDGVTACAFMKTWASLCRGSTVDVIQPNFTEASDFFPPRHPFPQEHLSLMESLWFTEGNYITRRFVFNSKAIASLRVKAKGTENDPTAKLPSRVETLSCFIWKCCMEASRETTGSTRPSILVETVNLRPRTKPPMSNRSMGDVFWWATAVANPSDETKTDLHDLVSLLNEAVNLYNSDYTETIQGDEGFQTISDYCDQLHGLFSLEKPDIFAFTSWNSFGFTRVNFGWGEPIWVGILGKPGPAFRNLTVLIDTKDGKGIEAWVTLDEERMTLLENNPEFLAFASPNPKFASL